MSPETLKAIISAALEAAKMIAKITPNTWDDKVVAIAEVIVAEVLGLFGVDGSGLSDEEMAVCGEAAAKIKAVI